MPATRYRTREEELAPDSGDDGILVAPELPPVNSGLPYGTGDNGGLPYAGQPASQSALALRIIQGTGQIDRIHKNFIFFIIRCQDNAQSIIQSVFFNILFRFH